MTRRSTRRKVRAFVIRGRASDITLRGIKRCSWSQQASAWDKAHLQADAIRIFEQHVVVARRPVAFLRSAHDRCSHLLEHARAPIHVLARAGSQAKMVQADTLLRETLGIESRITG